jgi:hypothetical protein
VQVSPVNLLSALLRHHIQSKPTSSSLNSQTAQVQALITELEAAPTVAEKLAILERVLTSDVRSSALGVPEALQESHVTAESEPAWRISSKSAESLSTLQPERYGRQWEVEAAIRAIFEHARLGPTDRPEPDLAVPFRPSASDMEKAIEALGYSTRSLFPEELRTERVGGDVGQETVISLRWMVMGVLLLTAIVVVVS